MIRCAGKYTPEVPNSHPVADEMIGITDSDSNNKDNILLEIIVPASRVNQQPMFDPAEPATITLQSGVQVPFYIWERPSPSSPMLIVAPDDSPDDWHEFTALLSPPSSPVLAEVSSALEILMFIWDMGRPVDLVTQGQQAAEWAADLVAMAPAAASSITICNGELSAKRIDDMHAISTLILCGRQSKSLTHESAVAMHDALRHSRLIEPEDCGEFPAKDNPDAAASAVNWFLAGSGSGDEEFSDSDPIDPKAQNS
jgi:pimeloyl-ACP methyl ester carboxylesterase